MVIVVVRLFDIELRVVFGDFEQFPVEVLPEGCIDDGMPIFGRKDEVIVAEVDTVTVPSVLLCVCHLFMVYGRRRIGYGNSLHPRAYATGYYARIKARNIPYIKSGILNEAL